MPAPQPRSSTTSLPSRDRHWGDVNCDGGQDLILNDDDVDTEEHERAGAMAFFLGGPGLQGELEIDAADLLIFKSTTYQDLGHDDWYASSDLNGDGCDDIITASPQHPTAGENTSGGETFIFFGKEGP